MYESTFENVKSSFQPLIELAELNRKTLEKMTAVQTSYLTDCISSSLKQVKTLAESGSPQRAAELSFEMIKEFETKLTGATEQNMAALTELQSAYSSLVNGSFKDAFAGSGLNVLPVAAQQAIVAAPAKQATVTKTPAKAPEVTAKMEAKPVVAETPVVAKKPATPVKAAPVVETKVASVAEVKAAPAVEAKSAPIATAKPATVKPAAAAAPKTPVRRAAAKPTVKKTPAKPAQH
ncbi:MAG: hypothetical protein ACJAWL_000905 [Motiliproteus sp.]|jgi:hypothetical protein